jgi:hypothetical protein
MQFIRNYMIKYISAEIKIRNRMTNKFLIDFFFFENRRIFRLDFFFWTAGINIHFLCFRDFIYLIIFFSEKCIFLEIIFLKIIYTIHYRNLIHISYFEYSK